MRFHRNNHKLRSALPLSAALLLSPLMIASFKGILPPTDKLILCAAETSAKLAAGSVYVYSQTIPDEEAVPEEEPSVAEVAAPSYLNLDDSFMLSRGELLIPSAENEEISVPDESTAEAEPYPESLESRDGIISAVTYGFMQGDDYINLDGGGQVRNVTSLSNDLLIEESKKNVEFKIEKNGEPQILIMHTHETETYEPYSRDFYDSSFTCRTTDDAKNMAAVGNAIAQQLEAAGIAVIHDVTKHDFPSYNNSYDRSRVTVQDILNQYPSIKVVLDIHRDAIERADGTRIAPVAKINGRQAAQVMIISGCDDGTMDMPDFMQNFRFACALQQQLESDFEGLTRPILFDYRKYNQDLTTGSILIEVGGHANSIDEAIYSGELIGKSLADLFSST